MKNHTKIALCLLASSATWTCAAPSIRDKNPKALWSASGHSGLCSKSPINSLESNGISKRISNDSSHEKIAFDWRIEQISKDYNHILRVSYKIQNDSPDTIYVLDRYLDQTGKLIPMMNIQNSDKSGVVDLIKGFVYTQAKPATLHEPEVSVVLPSGSHEGYAELPLPLHYVWNYGWETEPLFKKITNLQIWISYFPDPGSPIPWLPVYEAASAKHRIAPLYYIADHEKWLCTSYIHWMPETR